MDVDPNEIFNFPPRPRKAKEPAPASYSTTQPITVGLLHLSAFRNHVIVVCPSDNEFPAFADALGPDAVDQLIAALQATKKRAMAGENDVMDPEVLMELSEDGAPLDFLQDEDD